MKEKCNLCNDPIKTTFLDKIDGTIVNYHKEGSTKKAYICSRCQKEHKENLKEKILDN